MFERNHVKLGVVAFLLRVFGRKFVTLLVRGFAVSLEVLELCVLVLV